MGIYINQPYTLAFTLIKTADGSLDETDTPTVYTRIVGSGSAFAAAAAPTHVTGSGPGAWECALTAAQMNGGTIQCLVTATNCVPQSFLINTEADWSSARAGLLDDNGTQAGGSGVCINLGQTVGRTQTPGTLGRIFQFIRAFVYGKKVENAVANQQTLYDSDNTTLVATHTLTPSGGPYTTRSGTPE